MPRRHCATVALVLLSRVSAPLPRPGNREAEPFFVPILEGMVMTQSQLNQAVAWATGEPLLEIRRRGFGIAKLVDVAFDEEPDDVLPQIIDWDERDADRLVLFP